MPSLTAAAGLDPAAYIDAILERFANADLHHRLDQIAMDGSQKLPQRWIATVTDRLAQGLDSPRHSLSLAAWIAYTADAPRISDDPLRERFAAIWSESAADPRQVVARFVTELGIFPAQFDDAAILTSLADTVASWRAQAPQAALRTAIQERAA